MKIQKDLVPIILPKDVVTGNPAAPVKLVMFGDYESDGTAKASDVVADLLTDYEGKVNFVFRHFPLTMLHQKAHKASEAAIGAAQEGKFWEMHQYLLAHRRSLGIISLKSYAREVGVKDKKFLEHLINSDWGLYVQDDLRAGLELGITDIPTLYINGEKFEKDITLKNVKAYIDPLLKSKSKLVNIKERKRA